MSAIFASRSRHVCFLFGAGTSKSAGLPDLAGLQAAVLADLKGPHRDDFQRALTGRNLEQALSRLRKIQALLSVGETFDGFTAETARKLDAFVCEAIAKAITLPKPDLDALTTFASWAASADYDRPIEIFTTNYDLLIERALENVAAAYFDGFAGVVSGRFRADMIDAASPLTVPRNFVRLWKLHGSVNWREQSPNEIVRTGTSTGDGTPIAIYPSEEKYAESRRSPFLVLMDRLRSAASEPETVILTAGYSFGDQHINQILFDSLQHHPRSQLLALSYGSIPAPLEAAAMRTRNIVALSRDRGIIGGSSGAWAAEDPIPDVFTGTELRLGDFAVCACQFKQIGLTGGA